MIEYFRSAVRALRRAPVVTGIAVASLALGIGANAAIFSVFNRAMLRALPVTAPEQLVIFSSPGPRMGRVSSSNAGGSDAVFTYPMFSDLERLQSVFTAIAAHREFPANVSYGGRTVGETALLVSGSYFPVLGVRPAIGRLLAQADDTAPGANRLVVLSYGYWQARLAGSEAVLNDTLVVNGEPLTIIGVAPRGFNGTAVEETPALFVPLSMAATLHTPWEDLESRKDYWLYLIARLKPGVSRESAQAAINSPYASILRDVELHLQGDMSVRAREEFSNRQIVLDNGARGEQPGQGELALIFLLLFAITGTVILIACANIANLLMVRGIGRAGEFAVRFALGARRSQLVAQLLAESFVLAVVGAVAGLIVLRWTLDLLAALPAIGESFVQFEIDLPLVLFVLGLSLAAALLMGLLPAVHTTRVPAISSLKTQGAGHARAGATRMWRSALVSAQIALALALIAVAGLFARSLVNISRVDLGMNVQQITTFRMSPILNGYTAEQSRVLFERVEEELAALPGVTSVSASTVALLAGDNSSGNVTVEAFKADADTDSDAFTSLIGPGLLRTLGVPLIAGREFARSDSAGTQRVAIVNEAFAQKFNLGRAAVGKRMQLGRSSKPDLNIEIVGLVQNAKYSSVKQDAPPQFFLPYRQRGNVGSITFYVRSSLDAAQILSTVPRVVASLDGNLPVEQLRTMGEQVREHSALDRMISYLSAAFAVLATSLAAIGLYGLLAFTVAQRTQEIGVRMALGADSASIRRMILSQVGRLAGVGVTIGLLAAAALASLAGSLLFGLNGIDPLIMVLAAGGIVGVAFAAAAIPARRAVRIDPSRALRWE